MSERTLRPAGERAGRPAESSSQDAQIRTLLDRQKERILADSHNLFIGLMIVGKHAWLQEEEQKGDSSTVLMIQEQLFISELIKDIQDAILLILHYKTM